MPCRALWVRRIVIGGLALGAVMISSLTAFAAVEDVLLEKGQITKEEWIKIKAEKEKDVSFQFVERMQEPTTGQLIAGSGYERLRFKNVFIAIGGFVEATGLYRSANQNADVGSTFGNIPLSGTANSKLSEFRGTARQSRVSLLAETEVMGVLASGYVETDFLGATPVSNQVESNSWALRLRQFWATADFPSGLSITAGQGWSLLATHRSGLRPRSEYIPLTIDAQYVVGYNWARQFEFRVTKDFGNGIWTAVSIENPEMNTGGVILPPNVQGLNNSQNAQAPASLLVTSATPGANGIATEIAPDVLAKTVFEPGWGHWEIKAVGRFFRDRLNGNNHVSVGGGVGGAAIMPLHTTFDVILEGLAGVGIGRYASGIGPDFIVKPDGTVVPIRAVQFMGGFEWHPTPAWDIYNYAGVEYYDRAAYSGTNIGYGSPLNNLAGCNIEIPGACQAANKSLWQVQPGFWYRVYRGKEGIAAVGASYSYTHRQLWLGQGVGMPSQPTGTEHIAMVAMRWYLP